jgi:hypothetical protein
MDSGELPAFSGEGEWSGPEYTPMVYGSNDLWLEITNVVDTAADFIIHTPEVAAYDLLGTTNLALEVPGLNATNWAWLARTDVGQTNVTLPGLWPEIGFFRLGTMLDTDFDGLPDAVEHLVSHSNPGSANPDGDDLNDYEEYLLGRNPHTAGAVPDTGGMTGLQLFTALQ